MPLKRVLENLDDLDENLKPLYVERNNKFYLDAEDEPETAALRRARDRETEAARQLREKLAEKEAELMAALNNDVKPSKKVDELEASWRTKLEKLEKELKVQLANKDKYIETSLIEAASAELAGVFIVPSVGKRLVKDRLTVEFGDGGPTIRVLDAAGSPSAMSISDLRKEILDTAEYAPILTATKASGGGASAAVQGSGGGAGKSFKDMSTAERTHLYRTDRVRFDREAAILKGN